MIDDSSSICSLAHVRGLPVSVKPPPSSGNVGRRQASVVEVEKKTYAVYVERLPTYKEEGW